MWMEWLITIGLVVFVIDLIFDVVPASWGKKKDDKND